MDLHFHHAHSGNFGDDLNQWLWDEILPGWRDAWPDTVLIGVGTLVNHELPRGPAKLILGSGVGYGRVPDAPLLAQCRILSLRGPRSARTLGLDPALGILDPAAMIPLLPGFRDIPRSGRPIFVPHESSVYRQDWERLCNAAGVDFVSPRGESREVIRRLAAAPLVIAESMHAAILADAFGTPWRAVSISHRFNGTKWLDWSESVGIADPEIRPLYPLLGLFSAPAPDHGARPLAAPAIPYDPTPAPVPARRAGGDGWRLRQRRRLEAWLTPAALRREAAAPGRLSPRPALEAAQARYQAVLDRVKAEF